MNFINSVYYINLEQRVDRKDHILSQLKSMDVPVDKIHRINAVYCPEKGAIGCTKSHILAVTAFIESGLENCIILEDDFEFTESKETFESLLNLFFNEIKEYDVLMLSSNTCYEETINPWLTKIFDAYTASGYCLNKNFANVLLQNLKEGLALLEQSHHSPSHALDVYWKPLQRVSKWYCLKPKIGKQMASYSDIEKRDVDYGV